MGWSRIDPNLTFERRLRAQKERKAALHPLWHLCGFIEFLVCVYIHPSHRKLVWESVWEYWVFCITQGHFSDPTARSVAENMVMNPPPVPGGAVGPGRSTISWILIVVRENSTVCSLRSQIHHIRMHIYFKI